jgi:hypothetical protein
MPQRVAWINAVVSHFSSPKFWEACEKLPAQMRALAGKNFKLLKAGSKPSVFATEKDRAVLVCSYWAELSRGRG